MTPEEAYRLIRNKIRKNENYIPREYKTVGGMWTVDTWKLGETSYNLTEGDSWIFHPNPRITVREDYSSNLHYEDGTEEDLITLAESL